MPQPWHLCSGLRSSRADLHLLRPPPGARPSPAQCQSKLVPHVPESGAGSSVVRPASVRRGSKSRPPGRGAGARPSHDSTLGEDPPDAIRALRKGRARVHCVLLGKALGNQRLRTEREKPSQNLKACTLAERGGFEPPIRLPVCRISSAVLSTTQPPLQARIGRNVSSLAPNQGSPNVAADRRWCGPACSSAGSAGQGVAGPSARPGAPDRARHHGTPAASPVPLMTGGAAARR